MSRTFGGGLLIGGLATAVVGLAIAVIVLATDGDDDEPSSSASATKEECGPVEFAGGPAAIEISAPEPSCDEARQVVAELEAKGTHSINEPTPVGEWTCTEHPLADYPLLVECDGPGSFVVNGTAPSAHEPQTPTTTAAAPAPSQTDTKSCGDLLSDGAFLGNVQASGVACGEALAVVREWRDSQCFEAPCTLPSGYECSTVRSKFEFQEWLCVSAEIAIRFETGA